MRKTLTNAAVLLFCLFIQFEPNFAHSSQRQSSSVTPNLGDLKDKAKKLAKPEASFDMISDDLRSEVKVNITVDEQGNVIKAEAVSGIVKLRPAAEVAAKATKFEPYLVKGKAVKFSGSLVLFVGMTDKEKADMEELGKTLEDWTKQDKAEAQKLYDKGDYPETIKRLNSNLALKFDTDALELRAYANFKLNNSPDAIFDFWAVPTDEWKVSDFPLNFSPNFRGSASELEIYSRKTKLTSILRAQQ